MDLFTYRGGIAHCEDVPLARIAESLGTPAYVYSRSTLARHCANLQAAFAGYPTLPCFAVKANSNLSVLSEIFAHGFGADLVSLGELERARAAGAPGARIVFSGVGKRDDEIRRALDVGILSFNVESAYELAAIARLAAEAGRRAPVSLRINPNIDAKTNPKIATGLYSTKFGLAEDEALALLDVVKRDPHLELVGLACHIGSQIVDLGPKRDAGRRMAELAQKARRAGHELRLLNMGGGLGIRYRDETPPSLADYAGVLIDAVRPTGLDLVIEPGRVLVGNVGVLLTRVIGVKKGGGPDPRHFVVLDAAMNDLLRPTLYESYHEILPAAEPRPGAAEQTIDFVGPICETGDYLGKDRRQALPAAGDLFFVRGCGAYGSSMASQYNSRPRAVEVMVEGKDVRVVRPREDLESLWAAEKAALRRP